MKRLISILMAVSMLVAVNVSGFTAVLVGQQSNKALRPLPLRRSLIDSLPPGLVYATPEGRAAYEKGKAAHDKLTPEERKEVMESFVTAIAPVLEEAFERDKTEKESKQKQKEKDILDGEIAVLSSIEFISTPDPVDEPDDPPGVIFPDSVDLDGDGLTERFEKKLANKFTPEYHVSTGERPGTGFATFQDRSDAQIVQQVFPPTPPISYYRVKPLGIVNGQGYIQIDYLTLWNRDDGLDPGGDCTVFLGILAGLVGVAASQLIEGSGPHPLDNERSAVRVVAPTVGGQFDTRPSAYRMDRLFTAAHEDTQADRSEFFFVDPPAIALFHIPLGLSRSKHGPMHLIQMVFRLCHTGPSLRYSTQLLLTVQ